MLFVSGLAFQWTLMAVLLWGAIRVVDRYNVANSFGWALGYGAVLTGAAVGAGSMGLDYIGLILYVGFLLSALIKHYEIGILRAMLVTGLCVLIGPYLMLRALIWLAEASEPAALALMVAFPSVTLVAWWRGRGRVIVDPMADVEGTAVEMPVARARRRARPAAAPAPVVVRPALIAPPVRQAPAAGDKPSLLV